MLSQNQVKHITALRIKKYREEFGQFTAEGHKLVVDLINSSFNIAGIYASSGWITGNISLVGEKNIPFFETLPREMDRISSLATPSQVLAVVNIPATKSAVDLIDELISPSTHQPISPSSHQHIGTLAHQHIGTSAHQHISPSTHQPISPSSHQHIGTSAHQPISPSAHQPISPSAH